MKGFEKVWMAGFESECLYEFARHQHLYACLNFLDTIPGSLGEPHRENRDKRDRCLAT
jgi:hypothetical protein